MINDNINNMNFNFIFHYVYTYTYRYITYIIVRMLPIEEILFLFVIYRDNYLPIMGGE